MDNPKGLFHCYSPNLQNYLIEKGFKVVKSGLNKRTKKVFLCFRKSEKLDLYLLKWKLNKRSVS